MTEKKLGITEQGIKEALEELSHGRADESHEEFMARGVGIIAAHCETRQPEEWTIECGTKPNTYELRLDEPGNLKQIVIEFLKWDGGEGSLAYDAHKYAILRSALRKLTAELAEVRSPQAANFVSDQIHPGPSCTVCGAAMAFKCLSCGSTPEPTGAEVRSPGCDICGEDQSSSNHFQTGVDVPGEHEFVSGGVPAGWEQNPQSKASSGAGDTRPPLSNEPLTNKAEVRSPHEGLSDLEYIESYLEGVIETEKEFPHLPRQSMEPLLEDVRRFLKRASRNAKWAAGWEQGRTDAEKVADDLGDELNGEKLAAAIRALECPQKEK